LTISEVCHVEVVEARPVPKIEIQVAEAIFGEKLAPLVTLLMVGTAAWAAIVNAPAARHNLNARMSVSSFKRRYW
jgi:hypothetical protein